MKKIVGIVGTNSLVSTNRKLLEYIQAQFFYKVDVDIIEIKSVPLMDYREDNDLPPIVEDIKNRIEEAEAVIIATPEYDHSPTASLLNLLAWLSYKVHPFAHKPVMIVSASHGQLGASRAQNMLRQIMICPEINARVFSKQYLLPYSRNAYDEIGDLRSRDKIQEMERYFEEFLEFVNLVNKSQNDLINIHEFDDFKWDAIKGEEK